jgi:hypothetical protein
MRSTVLLLLLLAAVAYCDTVKKTHIHVETEEFGGGYTILSPIYYALGLVPGGDKLSDGLRKLTSWIPPALLAIPAISLATLVTGAWTFAIFMAASRAWNHWQFTKALKAVHGGPVIVTKSYSCCTTAGAAKMTQFLNTHVIPYLSKQPGMVKYSIYRGLGGCSGHFCAVVEWATLDDARKAYYSPDAKSLYANAPWGSMLMLQCKDVMAPHMAVTGAAGRSAESTGTARKVVS